MPENNTVATVIHARWVLTMDPNQPFLENQSIAVDKGRIAAIAPRGTLSVQAAETIELSDHVVMPGLINAHGHASMTLFRGLADDLPLMEWLQNHIWPAEGRWVDEAFTQEGALLAMAEMIRSGTTCFSDMYFYPNVVAKAAASAHMRCQLSFPILDFPTNWAQNADEYLRKGLQLHDDYRNHPLINIAFGPHAPYTVSDAPLKKVAAYSVETNMAVQIHLHETAFEVEEAVKNTGQRPIARLNELGLLNPQLQAVHMTQLTDEEITLLAETGTHVIHCPESNLKLASGFCPIAKLVDAGVNVALGTDGAASNNDLDMFGEMRTAALLAKGVSQNPSAIPAQTALQMATINGARALGIDELTGSLEVGKAADMIAVHMDDVTCQPHYHVESQLVYATPASQVTDSWIGGKQVMRNRQLTTIDLEDILTKAKLWKAQIQMADEHPNE
ncbi:MAG: N-ethylammeline chlorohydrolase [Pseudomonadales bacterium]|nr:N-ethylammeline chlorohydrolase [Pseudomonadales bacterium]